MGSGLQHRYALFPFVTRLGLRVDCRGTSSSSFFSVRESGALTLLVPSCLD